MLAEIMQTAKSGTCEAGACFVRTEDNGIIGLKTGDDYIEGCTVYRCTVRSIFLSIHSWMMLSNKHSKHG